MAPAIRAKRSASCVAPVRISCPTRTTSDAVSSTRRNAARTSTDVRTAFAPLATAMHVLALRVDEDQRHPGRLVGKRQQPADVDALSREGGLRLNPEGVAADRPDEGRRRTEPGGRDRLVGTLAAVVAREPPADDGLAAAEAADPS